MILCIFHHDKGCRGVGTVRNSRNVLIDEWIEGGRGIEERAGMYKENEGRLAGATLKQNWTPDLPA